MKGKLVQLSSYGNNLKCFARFRCKVGIVLDTAVVSVNIHYEIMWAGDTRSVYNHTREVKCAK